ncbi:MAG: 2-hydroxyacid dehydrogenase [Proteobacteria bacterium]|nr:2-hydroxyacid dehydrogenase [Pseudomonadota bacterium]
MSGKEFIVQFGPLDDFVNDYLAQHYEVLELWREPDPLACLERRGAAAKVAVTTVRRGCDADVIRRMPALQAICSWGVGYETIDVAAASARGVRVSYTPDVLTDCVADLAWGLLIAAARRTSIADRYVKAGEWRSVGAFPLTTRVSGKRLGILGLGRIGEAIVRRGQGFDMQVRYHDLRARPESPYAHEPTLVELARWADFLVVACQGGAATHHLVSREVIDALGPEGILINIARGTVIDQAAMIAALAEGRLGGAGLDVLEKEPPELSQLMSFDQVTLTPHVGSATRETRRAMGQLVLDNVDAFFRDGSLLTPIPA